MTDPTSAPTRPASCAGCCCWPTPGDPQAREVARDLVAGLTAHGLVVRLLASEAKDLGVEPGRRSARRSS